MPVPPAVAEDRLAVLAARIAAHPLAPLISRGSDGLTANPVPLRRDPAAQVLRGQWTRPPDDRVGVIAASDRRGHPLARLVPAP